MRPAANGNRLNVGLDLLVLVPTLAGLAVIGVTVRMIGQQCERHGDSARVTAGRFGHWRIEEISRRSRQTEVEPEVAFTPITD